LCPAIYQHRKKEKHFFVTTDFSDSLIGRENVMVCSTLQYPKEDIESYKNDGKVYKEFSKNLE
jgi:hypothetical protein